MTIDERLDRLTERHEALTQSVEILAQTAHEHRQQLTDLMEAAARRFTLRKFTKTAFRVWRKASRTSQSRPRPSIHNSDTALQEYLAIH